MNKKERLDHLKRQYIKWTNWWIKEKDEKKKEMYKRNVLKLSKMIER